MTDRLLPVVDDIDTGGFFTAAAEGRLTVCHCGHCDTVLHMPRAYCHVCGSFEPTWQDVAPTGTVYSFIVVTHQVNPAFPVPHTVLLIELDERPGVRMMGHLDGRPEIAIGQRVTATFEELADGVFLPRWSPA